MSYCYVFVPSGRLIAVARVPTVIIEGRMELNFVTAISCGSVTTLFHVSGSQNHMMEADTQKKEEKR